MDENLRVCSITIVMKNKGRDGMRGKGGIRDGGKGDRKSVGKRRETGKTMNEWKSGEEAGGRYFASRFVFAPFFPPSISGDVCAPLPPHMTSHHPYLYPYSYTYSYPYTIIITTRGFLLPPLHHKYYYYSSVPPIRPPFLSLSSRYPPLVPSL